jgi:SOS-response transcriptional repressor LexA
MTFTSFACNLAHMKLGKKIEALLKDKGKNMTELAAVCGVTPQAVQQWVAKDRFPRGPRLKLIADFLEVSEADLFRDVDEADIRPDRVVNMQALTNVAPGPGIKGMIPLISWVRAGAFCETHDPFAPGDAERWLPCPVSHGPNTFALRVKGRSMDGEDGYREGEMIFVDPDQTEPQSNKDYIIKQADGSATFKRLKEELDGWYLLALNPDWEPRYIKMPENSHICGRVIYSARDR